MASDTPIETPASDGHALIYRKISDLIPDARNSRTHSDEQVRQLAGIIREFGFTSPALVRTDGKGNLKIIAGHARCLAAALVGLNEVPTINLDYLTANEARAYAIADNRIGEMAGWDYEMLGLEFAALEDEGFDLDLTGFDEADRAAYAAEAFGGVDNEYAEGVLGSMVKNYGWPPFSVLDTRRAEWQERKRAWMAVIGDTGETREGTLADGNIMEDIGSASILDAVLAEMMLRWFAPGAGKVFDPFAGDTVFGFVAGYLGHKFTGIELRPEQSQLNQARCDAHQLDCRYITDTAENMDKHIANDSMDFIFSCPPYADLEVYSSNPKDLSNMTHSDFFKVYAKVLANTYAKLKNNRFTCITIGEVRDKTAHGAYISLVPKTIEIMCGAGYAYYNELILVNAAGTLPLRAGKSMTASRKTGKQHQNVLVFVKGSPQLAAAEFGEITTDPEHDPAGDESDGN